MVLIIDNGNTFLKATIYTNNGKEVDFSETKSKQKLDSFFNKIKIKRIIKFNFFDYYYFLILQTFSYKHRQQLTFFLI